MENMFLENAAINTDVFVSCFSFSHIFYLAGTEIE